METDKFLRWAKNKYVAISLATIVLSAYAGWNIFIKEKLEKLSQFDTNKVTAVEKRTILKRMETIDVGIRSHEKNLVRDQSASWLIRAINKMAEKSGIILDSVSPQQIPGGELSYNQLLLRLDIRSSYHRLGDFSSRIENYRPMIKITNVQIGWSEKDAGSVNNLLVTMHLSAFRPGKAV